jgi:hypothetical protein
VASRCDSLFFRGMHGEAPDREPLAAVLRSFQFIDSCDGVVFHGNPTVAAGVHDQIILARRNFPVFLPGSKRPELALNAITNPVPEGRHKAHWPLREPYFSGHFHSGTSLESIPLAGA